MIVVTMGYNSKRMCYEFRDDSGTYEYYPDDGTFLYRTGGRAIVLNIDTLEIALRACWRISQHYK